MELISVDTGGSGSRIYLGYNWENVREMLPGKSVIIITDNNVYDLYSDRFPPYRVLKLAPGEESKQLDTIRYLAEELLNSGIDRTGFILGIGGGVVCDITGFLASVYMRGVSFGFVSTTLLSGRCKHRRKERGKPGRGKKCDRKFQTARICYL